MRWFKLDTAIASDAKVMRLFAKHGAEGFGLYILILSLIAKDIDADHHDCQLEHTTECLRSITGVTTERIDEVLKSLAELGLITWDDTKSQYICSKILRRLDNWTTRKMNSGATTESLRHEEKRKEKKRREHGVSRVLESTPDILKSRLAKLFLPPQEEPPTKGFTLEERFPGREAIVYELYRFLSNGLSREGKIVENPEKEIDIAQWLSSHYKHSTLNEYKMKIEREDDATIASLEDFALLIEAVAGPIKQGDVL
jgi:hypothetical protein